MRTFIYVGVFLALIPLSACTEDYGSTRSPIYYDDCTLTQGYWKNHPKTWPVTTLTLGSVSYTQSEALAVFRTPVEGNGLISLAHQLMASKLNVAAGSTDAVASAMSQADAMIGSLVVPTVGKGALPTTTTSSLAQALDDYNMGETGPGHCDGTEPPECLCGDGVIHSPEECDDGNRSSGDGCSSYCKVEIIN